MKLGGELLTTKAPVAGKWATRSKFIREDIDQELFSCKDFDLGEWLSAHQYAYTYKLEEISFSMRPENGYGP